jgi:hypothetical protein
MSARFFFNNSFDNALLKCHSYKWLHDSCKKLIADTTNKHSIAKSNHKEALSTAIQCTALRIRDNNSLKSAAGSGLRKWHLYHGDGTVFSCNGI